MYDIKPLEEEWKKYKLKRRRPVYYVMFFFIIIIFFINIGNFTKINEYISTFYKTATSANTREKNKLSNTLLMNNALTVIETRNTVGTSNNNSKSSNLLVDIPILDTTSDIKSSSERKKVFLDIIESSSVSAYEDVEKRFAQSHDIDDALFLAKSYYKKANYKKAAYWAYEVNKLNENMEESLLIFVQSKVKLGHVNEAKSILSSYIKKSNSSEAKKILSKIDNNTL